ncbi:copper chaperone [Haematobacter massiliensis]|mgnify:FL=1|uniref:Heavy metal transporter n=1 Tax=Haematobacter massiliensis TaxID=195105 RepID=A0A086Y0A0_9RHOB|nr:heavy-metal-associated domain-containing protein [Haematobacter massiliensis]KFI27700.1 heavy metal transporter [Haematobacter massiliensis]OWJ71829.1 copper chaperone [Haematobacter massiliensis]OWJ83134.1 copper chaperone [Haematobacter massiliensis]QBJ23954.1 copper chaperone [Haematobacter massiliensis]
MQDFIVNDMSCGHCVATIQKAFAQAMPEARVDIDLSRHLVSVNGDAARAADVIREAGYTPETA